MKDSSKEEGEARNDILRTKVKTVARLTRLFKNLRFVLLFKLLMRLYRENSEMLIAIKKMSPDGKIPRGLLLNGRPAIKDTYKEFE